MSDPRRLLLAPMRRTGYQERAPRPVIPAFQHFSVLRLLFSGGLGLAFTLGFLAPAVQAQEVRVQTTPFTAWLDFAALNQPDPKRPSWPIWLESVEIIPANPDEAAPKTVIRIRLRSFAGLSDELMVRLFFTDETETAPVISAWAELGNNVLPRRKLGSGIGLPTSETVIVTTKEADYLEIEMPGDGSTLQSALLTSLRKAETRHALDFHAPAALSDPFEAAPHAHPAVQDAFLFGRVKATLDDAPLRLSGADGNAGLFEFELEAQPLLAVLTFEVLNVDVANPPEVLVNQRPFGPATLLLPDLADPGFRGTVHPAERDLRFRYVGWIRCQKLIPGSFLRAGENAVLLQTADATGSVAVRSVEVQLKYEPSFPAAP